MKTFAFLLTCGFVALASGPDKPASPPEKPPVIPQELQLKGARLTAKSLRLDMDIQQAFGDRIKEVRADTKQFQDAVQSVCGANYTAIQEGEEFKCSAKPAASKK